MQTAFGLLLCVASPSHLLVSSMKKLPLCLLVVIAFVGCNKPEAEDTDSKSESTPSTHATPRVAKKNASPAPAANDWMWKTSKGKPRDNDPLGSNSDNPLEHKTKK